MSSHPIQPRPSIDAGAADLTAGCARSMIGRCYRWRANWKAPMAVVVEGALFDAETGHYRESEIFSQSCKLKSRCRNRCSSKSKKSHLHNTLLEDSRVWLLAEIAVMDNFASVWLFTSTNSQSNLV